MVVLGRGAVSYERGTPVLEPSNGARKVCFEAREMLMRGGGGVKGCEVLFLMSKLPL